MNTTHLVNSLEDLESHYPTPRKSSSSKVQNQLTEPMIRWLGHSPFFVLSSVANSSIDCSPRGDKPGEAFQVIDRHTIAIPDRRGNNRIDTLKNILQDPRVGLVFLIPGVEEALRIKGSACISVDPALLNRFTLDDIPPATVMLITVESAYVQNARAIRAADLWNGDSNVSSEDVPSVEELYNRPK